MQQQQQKTHRWRRRRRRRWRRRRRRRENPRVYACQSTEHVAKDCPLLAKVRSMMATESPNVAENKATASGAACKYLKCPLVPAFLTTALLASATTPTSAATSPLATPTLAHFDTAATASMGPDVRFLKNPRPSNVGIEVYNNEPEVVRNNIEGTFVSHSAEGDLPDGERGYENPTLPTMLISGPQVVFQYPKQDVVLSERHECFMQPTSTSCPICHPNDKRINFNTTAALLGLPWRSSRDENQACTRSAHIHWRMRTPRMW